MTWSRSSQAGNRLVDGSEDIETASPGNLLNETLNQDDETTVQIQNALLMSLRRASDSEESNQLSGHFRARNSGRYCCSHGCPTSMDSRVHPAQSWFILLAFRQ